MLMGSLFLFVRLFGIEILGMLVRFIGIVVMLFRYICSGLLICLLSLNVVVGVDGVVMMLILVKVFVKFCWISVWIFCVLLQYVLQYLVDRVQVLRMMWCFILLLKLVLCVVDMMFLIVGLLLGVICRLKCMELNLVRLFDVFVGRIRQQVVMLYLKCGVLILMILVFCVFMSVSVLWKEDVILGWKLLLGSLWIMLILSFLSMFLCVFL